MNPRSRLRQPAREARSPAPPTPAPDLAPGAPQRATSSAPLWLYKCPPLAAWLTVATCCALKAALRPAPRLGQHLDGWRPMPCYQCPGVVELHEGGATPAPRRVG